MVNGITRQEYRAMTSGNWLGERPVTYSDHGISIDTSSESARESYIETQQERIDWIRESNRNPFGYNPARNRLH